MTAFDNQLLLHLRLDALPGGKVQDSSSHARHGTVTGAPSVVPDERFGSSLRFAGTDTVAVSGVTPQAAGSNPVHSIAGWVWLDSYPAKREWLLLFGQAGPGAHHWLINPDGRTQLGVWNGGAATPPLPTGTWVHVATTYDGKALYCYLDGKPWGTAQPAAFNYTAWSFGLAKPELSEAGFAGRLAAVRVYERALSAEEIRQVIEEDQSAMAAFRRSHPLAFSLHDKDDQSVLAIVDDPTGNSMRLEVTNSASQSIVLAPVDPASGKCHLELRFRPGTLPAGSLGKITMTGPAGWTMRIQSQPDGTVAFALSCKDKREIKPGETVGFTLQNIGADGVGGTRGTRVQLSYAEMSYPDEPSALRGRRVRHLSIVNRRGQQHIPLQVGFVGFNTIIADGASTSDLRLRIANVSKQPIPLTPSGRTAPSAFVLSFDVQKADSPAGDWVIGKSADLKNIVVKAEGWVAAPPTEQGQTLAWRLTTPTQIALVPGKDIVVNLTGIIARPPSGHTHLYVHYENMPGYWDGHLAVTVEKGPLVCRDMPPDKRVDARVGIGTATPLAKLHVAGGAIMPSAGNGETAGILFPKDPAEGSGDAAWIRYYPRTGEATTFEIGTSNDANDHIALMPSAGNVGVNTNAPEGRLQIMHTNQDGNGNALVIGPVNASNLRLGYHQDYSWVQSHGNRPLAINPISNRVGVGLSAPDGTLDVARGSAPGGTALFRGTQRISHFNYSTDEHTYIRGGKDASNVYINDSGGNVAIGATDPQGHKLLVNGAAKVLGLRINSNHQFNRVQGAHFVAGSHTGGTKVVRINFPEPFGSAPRALVTARNEIRWDGLLYPDIFAITVNVVDHTHMMVNILRLDALRGGWDQQLRLDWIAWE
ncbi:MAG TPA: LamG domain-containing protein [Actinophytocola sp.]|uniref:LamG domain-containing protein n=1 Tax=Actinophytocola sp. TaxID=1872138 RepID=UPI002DDCFD1B|nr:LamG domain-containing protein [Actinophytocola sp.]HEV2783236.1 LamG domain-containing protein [Actinophytocola sp.]